MYRLWISPNLGAGHGLWSEVYIFEGLLVSPGLD